MKFEYLSIEVFLSLKDQHSEHLRFLPSHKVDETWSQLPLPEVLDRLGAERWELVNTVAKEVRVDLSAVNRPTEFTGRREYYYFKRELLSQNELHK